MQIIPTAHDRYPPAAKAPSCRPTGRAPAFAGAGSGRPSMCGRPAGFKGVFAEKLAAGTSAIMCPALWCGIDDRGPDGFRERALNTSAASQCAVGCHGVSRSSVRPIAIFCYRPFTQDDERVSQPPAVAGMPRRSSSWPTRHGPSCWPAACPSGGGGDRRQLARAALQQRQQPCVGMPIVRLGQPDHRGRAEHQQLAQPFIALARDPAQAPRPVAG